MIELEKSFGLKLNEHFHLFSIIDNDLAKKLNNPYHFDKNSLLDSFEQIDDVALGALLRDELLISRTGLTINDIKGNYFFFKENGSIAHRPNNKQLLDIMNVLLGNVFLNKDEMTEAQKERVMSAIKMLSNNVGCIFPVCVDADKASEFSDLAGKLVSGLVRVKGKELVIDKTDEDMDGTLGKIFRESHKGED